MIPSVATAVDHAHAVDAVAGSGVGDGAQVEVQGDLHDGEQQEHHQHGADHELDGARSDVIVNPGAQAHPNARRCFEKGTGDVASGFAVTG